MENFRYVNSLSLQNIKYKTFLVCELLLLSVIQGQKAFISKFPNLYIFFFSGYVFVMNMLWTLIDFGAFTAFSLVYKNVC